MKPIAWRFAAALGALLAVAALPAATAAQDAAAPEEVRTEAPGFGGYTGTATASPVTMRMFDPTIPIPVDPGQPQLEGTLQHTSASLTSGPTSRAVASSVWPGAAFGDGFSTICECEQQWFVRAEASYPGGEPQAEQVLPTGGGMTVVARGLDVEARAVAGESPSAEVLGYGDMTSTSTATVRDGQAVSTTDTSAEGIALLGGVITMESVHTALSATSDAVTAATTGATTVSGLAIAGNGYAFDQGGLRPMESGTPRGSVLPLPLVVPGAEQLRDQMGIEVELMPHVETVNGADAAREAGGVRVTITTRSLASALGDVPLSDVLGQLPAEAQGEIYTFLAAAPRIELVFGRAAVRAAATTPIQITAVAPPPPFAPPPPTPAAPGAGARPGPPASSAAAPPPAPPSGAPIPGPATVPAGGGGVSTAPVPSSSDGALAPALPATLATSGAPAMFAGTAPVLVALALVAGAGAAKALGGLTALAFGGVAGPACSRGAVQRVPDLRSQD